MPGKDTDAVRHSPVQSTGWLEARARQFLHVDRYASDVGVDLSSREDLKRYLEWASTECGHIPNALQPAHTFQDHHDK
jgi:hypothetical protein